MSEFLKINGLCKSFQSGSEKLLILRNLALEVEQGQMIAITGASGCGKSTFLHLVGGMDRADAGVIRLEETDVNELEGSELADFRNQKIGFVFQFYHLLPELSVLENTVLPSMIGGSGLRPSDAKDRGIHLLEQFGLEHRLAHRPRELSGGERQRVAIARALINEPSVLLADEPTGNLDEDTGNEILDVISQLHSDGLSVVLVTHNFEIASRGTKSVHLRHGQLEHPATMA